MKVYVLIRNECCPYEFDNDYIEGVFLNENSANIQMQEMRLNVDRKFYDITFRIEIYEVKE